MLKRIIFHYCHILRISKTNDKKGGNNDKVIESQNKEIQGRDKEVNRLKEELDQLKRKIEYLSENHIINQNSLQNNHSENDILCILFVHDIKGNIRRSNSYIYIILHQRRTRQSKMNKDNT